MVMKIAASKLQIFLYSPSENEKYFLVVNQFVMSCFLVP